MPTAVPRSLASAWGPEGGGGWDPSAESAWDERISTHLAELGTTYVDALMLHFPGPDPLGCVWFCSLTLQGFKLN